MTETMDTARTHMVAAETIKAGVLLQEHCLPTEGGKYHRYEKGWDDKRIAAETSERLHEGHIMRLRRALEMKLEPSTNNFGAKGVQKRITALQERVDVVVESQKGLDQRITDVREATAEGFADTNGKLDMLIEQHNKLCDALSLNKLLDARDYRLVL